MSSSNLLPDFADEVSKLCYDHFQKLPKTGKPKTNKEWTLLAAIIMCSESAMNKELNVISMSTGTKCLGHSQLNNKGDLVNDSHAEVLARRAFMRFLYHHIGLVLDGKESSVFDKRENESKLSLKEETSFHFFVSHTPCGDASIFPKQQDATFNKRNASCYLQSQPKKFKTKEEEKCELQFEDDSVLNSSNGNSDIYRTGAKCVESGLQDPKGDGENYHEVGTLRTKPGRGDPTWSMSCSDKIALWNVCGLQGALISHFVKEPIYVASIILGKCPFSKSAIHRAVVDRLSKIKVFPAGYRLNEPFILQSSLCFEFGKEMMGKPEEKVVPCPASIIWSDVPNKPLDVCVFGRKQGTVKKNYNKSSSWVSVSRQHLFAKFLSLIDKMDDSQQIKISSNPCYLEWKRSALLYQRAKSAAFEIFDGWKRKPDNLQKFTCVLNKI